LDGVCSTHDRIFNLFTKVREESRNIRTLSVKDRSNEMAENRVNGSLVEPTKPKKDI
jgi:hypothetical protein